MKSFREDTTNYINEVFKKYDSCGSQQVSEDIINFLLSNGWGPDSNPVAVMWGVGIGTENGVEICHFEDIAEEYAGCRESKCMMFNNPEGYTEIVDILNDNCKFTFYGDDIYEVMDYLYKMPDKPETLKEAVIKAVNEYFKQKPAKKNC